MVTAQMDGGMERKSSRRGGTDGFLNRRDTPDRNSND